MKKVKQIAQHYKENSSWQWIGDLAIVLIPIIHAGIGTAPLSSDAKYWITFFCDITLVVIKFWAKTQNYISNLKQ